MNVEKEKQVVSLLKQAKDLIESAYKLHEGGRGTEGIFDIQGKMDNLVDLMEEDIGDELLKPMYRRRNY